MTLHHSSHLGVVKVSLLDCVQKVLATCSHDVNGHRTRDCRYSRESQDECTLLCEQVEEVAGKIAAMELSHDRSLVDSPLRCYHSSHSVHTLATGRVQCCHRAHHSLRRNESFVDGLNEMISHLVQVTGCDRPGTAAQDSETVVGAEEGEEMVLGVVEEEVRVPCVVEEEARQLLMVRSHSSMNEHLELVRLLVRALDPMVKHNVLTTAVAQAKPLEMSHETAHKTVPRTVFCSYSNQVRALVKNLLEVVRESWAPEVVY